MDDVYVCLSTNRVCEVDRSEGLRVWCPECKRFHTKYGQHFVALGRTPKPETQKEE